MGMVDMIANSAFTYKTRRLKAGDGFQASSRDAKVLEAIKKAREGRVPGEVAPPPPAIADKIARRAPKQSELAKARNEYKKATGKNPSPGWSIEQLREKIAASQS